MVTKNQKYALGAIVLIVIGYWALGGFNGVTLNNLTVSQQQGVQTPAPAPVTTTTTTTTSTAAPYTGQLTISLQERNAMDNSSPVREGSNLITTYYKSLDGVHFYTLGNGNTTITLDPTMNGIFYASVAPATSSQNFIVAPKTIQDPTLNPSVAIYDFMDPTGLGTKSWLFQINLANARLPPIQGGQVAPTLTLYINAYGYAAPTLNHPSGAAASQATGTDKTNTIYWILTGTNKDAIPISEVDVTVNATSATKYGTGLFFVTIPNVGNVYLSQMNPVIVGSNTTYQYKFQSGLSQTFNQPNSNILVKSLKAANFVVIPAQGGTQISMPVQIDTNFSTSADGLQVTLTVFWLQPTQSETSVKDCQRITATGSTSTVTTC
jgi:hypothetical protein